MTKHLLSDDMGNVSVAGARQNRAAREGKRQTDVDTEGLRRQRGEDLCVRPVSWLWAWSLCGPTPL